MKNKGFKYGIMVIVLMLGTMMNYSVFAQFAFELPSSANGRILDNSIQVAVSGKLALCSHTEKGSIILDVTGGTPPYTFLWNNLTTTQNRENLYAGTYTVVITDSKGLKHTENIVVQPPYPLILNPLEKRDATCGSGNDGYAKISVKVGRGEPYKVYWSNGLRDVWEASNLLPGTYTVIVADEYNCDVSVSFEIKSAAEGVNVTESIKDASCSGKNDGAISLNVTGGKAPYTFKWSNGSTSKDLSNLTSGTYDVVITDQTGCSFQASYKVGQPETMTVTTEEILPSCEGNSNGEIKLNVIGGTAPYTYSWSNGQSGATAKNLNAGTYSVRITDGSGCFIDKSFSLSNQSSLDLRLVTSQDLSCSGEEDGLIQIEVTGALGNYDVIWSDGITGALLREKLASGTYEVRVKDQSGCEVSKSVVLEKPQAIQARIETTLDVNCESGSVTGVAWVSIQGGKEPYTINWNTGDENLREINYFQSGSLKVTIKDALGCTAESEVKVDYPSLINKNGRLDFQFRKLEITSEPEVMINDEILFESEISPEFIAWEWEFGDGKKSTEKDPVHIFKKSGTYEVRLTGYDMFGCSSVEKNTVQVTSPAEMVVVPNAFTPNGDGLNDTFFPKIRAVSSFSMEVFNTWGEKLYSEANIESSGWDGTYKGQASPAGNYIFKITYSTFDGQEFSRTGGMTLIR
ncbi:gliding motility-associated C-terminal domain-containing protein [Algoriphagus sp. CAU 1675]|uniref:T9SS type B sorting domain-containing protein n=1 Tax=Algoriphagus sp. CAU 1675 TaxID=3032597 RepID=UPI0023DA1773|nr:gliding motility-associated C-terminal domain-containing protein [Algoriphagus sp. CAU 1675]MDF2156589.1 gliding motility-associated C-terminal domain-containing protein [Algoriphagus sp. CAU 1675]